MKVILTSELEYELSTFKLRFRCEDCVHLSDDGGCSHGYPRPQLVVRGEPHRYLPLCKEFELA